MNKTNRAQISANRAKIIDVESKQTLMFEMLYAMYIEMHPNKTPKEIDEYFKELVLASSEDFD